jgi:hypothetical protein
MSDKSTTETIDDAGALSLDASATAIRAERADTIDPWRRTLADAEEAAAAWSAVARLARRRIEELGTDGGTS